MTLEAVAFGGLGSLSECAELDRKAWNAAFRSHGLAWDWSFEDYTEIMAQPGAIDLVARFAEMRGLPQPNDAARILALQRRAFATYLSRDLPLRSGVGRVLNWCARAGLKLALSSRADAATVRAFLSATAKARGGIDFDTALVAGDVPRPPPAADAYDKIVSDLRLKRSQVLAVADTPHAAQAAQAAGLAVLAFPSSRAAALSDAIRGAAPGLGPQRRGDHRCVARAGRNRR